MTRPIELVVTKSAAGAMALGLICALSGVVHAQGEPLAVGSPAPAFAVTAHDGRAVDLAKQKGKFTVLYFYPRDDTPGCTREAQGFRDNWQALSKAGVDVFGVSTDGNDSHKAFAAKYELPFPLLPDEKAEIAMKYNVPVVGNAARRITYLIGPDGRIAHVWPKVSPDGHAQEILSQVEALRAQSRTKGQANKTAHKKTKSAANP